MKLTPETKALIISGTADWLTANQRYFDQNAIKRLIGDKSKWSVAYDEEEMSFYCAPRTTDGSMLTVNGLPFVLFLPHIQT